MRANSFTAFTLPMKTKPSSSGVNRILTSEQKNILERWIKEGAEYETLGVRGAGQKALPPVKRTEWVRNPIDRFVLSKLDGATFLLPRKQGSSDQTLYSDLIGLPPRLRKWIPSPTTHPMPTKKSSITPASPRYGENGPRVAGRRPLCRQQRLSIRRETDQWVWRDWVVKALNEDMPFDRFTGNWQVTSYPIPQSSKKCSGFNRNHLNNGKEEPSSRNSVSSSSSTASAPRLQTGSD